MLPQATLEHERTQARTFDVVHKAIRKAWRGMTGNWERSWQTSVGPKVVEVVTAAQQTAAAQSDAYVTAVLAELGIATDAPGKLHLPAFADVAGDGRPVDSGLYGAVIHTAKAQYSPDLASASPAQTQKAALDSGLEWMSQYVETLLADAARAAEAVALAKRPWVNGYVRMLDPKNPCSRCIVLAGKFYLWNEGFLRHPACLCKHIPASEDTRDDVLTNPDAYFHSLTIKQQDEVFTNAGAEAVRLGADVVQVVNARRGMSTAQQNPRGWIPKGRLTPVDVFGRPTYITTEGVTKRGTGRKAMGSGRPVRLMPESILELAKDREDAIRLLKLYGYLT